MLHVGQFFRGVNDVIYPLAPGIYRKDEKHDEFICDKYLLSVWFDSNGYDKKIPEELCEYIDQYYNFIYSYYIKSKRPESSAEKDMVAILCYIT